MRKIYICDNKAISYLKSHLCVFLSLLVVFSSFSILGIHHFKASAVGTNLVVNGDAENGNDNWTGMDEWTFVLGGGATDTDKYAGEKSFIVNSAWHYMYQAINLEKDKTYTLSLYTKGNQASEVGLFTDHSNNESVLCGLWLTGNDNNWTLKEVEYTSTSDQTVYIRIKNNSGENNTRLFDNISVVVTEPTVNLVKNGSAENGNDNWTGMDEWTFVLGGGATDTDKYAGEKSFIVNSAWHYMYQAINLEKDKTYTLSLYTKGNQASEVGLFTDHSNNESVLCGLWLTDNDNNWTLKEVEYTSTSDQTVYIRIKNNTGENNTRLFDKISLTTETVEIDHNLIENGGAEKGNSNWTGSDEWTSVIVSDEHNSGNASFGIPDQYRYIYQELTLEKDKNYLLSLYTKGSSKGEIALLSNVTDERTAVFYINFENANANWSLVEKEFSLKESGTYFLRIKDVTGEASNNRLFDDISLVPLKADYGFVKNGGFDESEFDWSYSGVELPQIIDGGQFSTQKSLLMSKENGGKLYQNIDLEANDDYTLSFWTKGISDSVVWKILSGEFSQTNDSVIAKGTVSNSEDWENNIARFSTTDNAKICLVFENGGQDSTLNLDSVSIILSKNIVSNGDFEEALNSWTVDDGYFANSDENKQSGASGLEVKSASYKIISQKINIDRKIKNYKLSFYYCGDVPTDMSAWSVSKDKATFDDDKVLFKSVLSNENSTQWKRVEYIIDTNDLTSVYLTFRTYSGGKYFVDNVKFVATDSKADTYTKRDNPLIIKFQGEQKPDYKGPYICAEGDNLVTDGGFENGTGNWTGLLNDKITVTDETAAVYDGSKGLKFKTSNSKTEGLFTINVKANTNYYFTVYCKMPTWSQSNTGGVTFGVTDYETGEYIVLTDRDSEIARLVNENNQINPASPDGEWHILGVYFETNDTKKIGIKIMGDNSELYFDNMYLFEASKAVEYVATIENKTAAEVSNDKTTLLNCDDSINIIKNSEFKKLTDDFWSNSRGFSRNNSIVDSGSSIYGNALHYYNASKYPDRTYYIKWIDVEPNTSYTFSASYSVVKATNDAALCILSGNQSNLVYPKTVKTFSLGKDNYDENQMFKVAGTEFFTNDCNRIGIAIFNGGGEAWIDEIKLFETYDSAGKNNGSVLPVKVRDSKIPTKLVSSKYTIVNGCIYFEDDFPTIKTVVNTFNGKEYISVYNSGGEKITDWSLKFEDNMEIRLMDGPEILDRVKILKLVKEEESEKTDKESINSTIVITNEADNNLLAELIVENATIEPDFTPENKNYETTVEYKIEELIVKARPQSEKATVTIEGTELTYVGKNIVKVIVVSESGLKRTYKIYAERLAPEKQTSQETLFNWIWIIIAVVAFLLIAATVVTSVIIIKKKKSVK